MEPKHIDHDDDLGCKISKIKLSGEKQTRLKSALDEKSTPSSSKDDVAEAKLDLEVEREWKQLQNETAAGKIEISSNPKAKKIANGLVMYVLPRFAGMRSEGGLYDTTTNLMVVCSNHMNMRCGDTGKLMWQSEEWCGRDALALG